MKLFIANCSKQDHDFYYRVPERSKSIVVNIPSGRQHVISNTPEVIQHIINQHVIYGMQERSKTNGNFSGICYSIEREITESAIIDGAEQKNENLENLSKQLLTESAVAFDQAVDNAAIQSGKNPIEGGIEMEITGEAIDQDQQDAPSLNTKIKVKK